MTCTDTLIVFDCDGTLIDSQHVIVSAMQSAFAGMSLDKPARSAILKTIGLSIPEALSVLVPDLEAPSRDQLATDYREHALLLRQQEASQEPLFKGAAELLRDLSRTDGISLGIATGKSRRGVQSFLHRHHMTGIFTTVQTADDAPSKPHPAMLCQAMQAAGTNPENTVMIGDTSFDMAMAACANVTGIGVSWGYHSAPSLVQAGARHVAHSFLELSRLLDTYGRPQVRYRAVA